MRITALETIRCKAFANLLWLRLETDCGLVGLGEAFRNAEASEAYLHETLAPELLGRDPRPVAAHRERIGRVIANRFMGTPSRSIELRGDAAVDLALWDLLAQSLGVPLHRLWGGPVRERIRVYNTCAGPAYNTEPVVGWVSRLAEPGAAPVGAIDDLQAQLDDPVGLARSLLAEGVTALEIWPFDRFAAATGGNAIGPAELEAALAPIRAIRDALGEAVEILVECHGLWRLPAAVRIARALEPYRVFWLEDPIAMHRLDDLRRLKEATGIPLAGSENHGTAHWFREAFALGVIDYAHFDVGWMGGLSEALDVAALARAFDRPIAPHDCVGPVMLAANLQLLAAQPHGLWCETVRAYARGWYREVVEGLPEPEGGTIGFPEGPGLGVRLSPAFLARPDLVRRRSTFGPGRAGQGLPRGPIGLTHGRDQPRGGTPMSFASYLDKAQEKLGDLERILGELGERAGVVDAKAELEAVRERLKALRLQGADLSEEAVRAFTARLDALTSRIGALRG
jgi:galactonate dehydratase